MGIVVARVERPTALRVAAGLGAVLLAGCGSQLSPDDVARAQRLPTPYVAVTGAPAGAAAATATTSGGAASAPPASAAAGADAPGTTPSGPRPAGGQPGPAPTDRPSDSPDQAALPAGSCDGFHDQTGVTDDEITIANASDLTGPVPGIFSSSRDAVLAYAAYFNATSDICGRKLRVLQLDTRTDAGGDQQAYATACAETFAAVGSMAAFDSGGAATAQRCGLPDLRSTTVTGARDACTTCIAAQSGSPASFPDSVPDHLLTAYPQAAAHAGYLWINAGPAVENAHNEIAVWSRLGVHFDYTAGIDVAEFNYVPYVEQLRQHGVRLVRFLGAGDQAVRLARAMTQVGYHPDVFLLDASGYDPAFVDQGASDVTGTRIFVNFTPFEDADDNAELGLYLQWLDVVKPGAAPTYSGLFSWSAARLFTEQAQALGGDLSRAALVRRLDRVDRWTDHGLHPPQRVGARVVGPCWRFLRLDESGRWEPEAGRDYHCSGITHVG